MHGHAQPCPLCRRYKPRTTAATRPNLQNNPFDFSHVHSCPVILSGDRPQFWVSPITHASSRGCVKTLDEVCFRQRPEADMSGYIEGTDRGQTTLFPDRGLRIGLARTIRSASSTFCRRDRSCRVWLWSYGSGIDGTAGVSPVSSAEALHLRLSEPGPVWLPFRPDEGRSAKITRQQAHEGPISAPIQPKGRQCRR